MGRLDDRVIIVTGGAQGIGLAYCKRLCAEGASVTIADINGQAAAQAARTLGEDGRDVLAVTTDVSRADDNEQMVQATLERFGRIDGLVTNAAIYQRPAMFRGPFEEIPVDEWDRLMAVNLRGMFLSCKAVVPHMKQQRSGKIVTVASGTVAFGAPMMAHYVASKGGVIGFTRSLARELGNYGIQVNAIAPGLTHSMDEMEELTTELERPRMVVRCIQRAEVPEDVVGTMVFLCSSDSDFMTGQTLAVDGGTTMR